MQNPLANLEMSSVMRRLVHGALWSVIGVAIARGLALLAWIVLARFLGKEGFGEMAVIQTTVGMFGVFAGFGLGMVATKHVAEFRRSDPARAGRIIALSQIVAMVAGGLMGVVMLVIAPWLAANVLSAPHLGGLLRIGALLVLLSAVYGAQRGVLAGFEAFKHIAWLNFLAGTLSFPLIVGGVYLAGLHGAVLGLVATSAIGCVANHMFLRHQIQKNNIPLAFSGWTRERRVLWTFSLPAFLTSTMIAPTIWACSALLVNQPGGYEEMGLFNAAYIFRNMFVLAGVTIAAPLLPILADRVNAPNEQMHRVNIALTWAIGAIPALPFLCFPELAQILFGEQYSGRAFLQVMVITLLFTCIILYKLGLSRVLAVNNMMWWGVADNAFWSIFIITSAYFLVRWGATGLSASFALAYIVNTIVFIPLYMRLRMVPRSSIFSREAMVIWAAILALPVINWFDISLLVRGGLFPVVVVSVVWGFWRLVGPTASKKSTLS